MSSIGFVNQLLAVLTVTGDAGIVVIVGALIFRKETILRFFGRHALVLSFVVALVAMCGSLFYSEVAHYEPCKLCWFQRIFMYPQVFLLSLALYKKDKGALRYGVLLSTLGAAIALYHYGLALGILPSLACSAVGYSVSCAKQFVLVFGYITIPMMALTAFVLIVLLGIAGEKARIDLNADRGPGR